LNRLKDSPDQRNKLEYYKSLCEIDLLDKNVLVDVWDNTWDFIENFPGSIFERAEEVFELATFCDLPGSKFKQLFM